MRDLTDIEDEGSWKGAREIGGKEEREKKVEIWNL